MDFIIETVCSSHSKEHLTALKKQIYYGGGKGINTFSDEDLLAVRIRKGISVAALLNTTGGQMIYSS